MALISCGECGKEVSDKAASCPHCGAPLLAQQQKRGTTIGVERSEKSSVWKWLIGLPVGGFILLMIIGSCAANTPEGKERSRGRAAIDLCWEEQKKKSLDPGTARFVAGACEKMERDFEQRHGRKP